jgi:hypothetical protein
VKIVVLLALCVLSLQMLSFGEAEIPDGPTSQLPLLLRPNMKLDPGAVVVVGRSGNKTDVVASTFARLGVQSWINESTTRIPFAHPEQKLNFISVNTVALNSLKICNVGLENSRAVDQGFLLITVGGPEVNLTTKKINMELPVKFLKDYHNNRWAVTTFVQDFPEYYYGDEYGIIAFIPSQPHLNGETLGEVTNGNKQLGTMVVAGNGREGTLAAAMYLRDILNGTQVKGRWLLRELDKVLIWMASGEEQVLHPIVIVVKSTGEDSAEFVDIFPF